MSRQDILQVVVPAAGYYSEAANPASLETEVLFGERLTLLEPEVFGGYFKVQSSLYATPGFVHRKDLDVRYVTPTHRVCVPYANVYNGPNFKSGIASMLCLNAQVHVVGGATTPEGEMLHIEGLGWVFSEHLIRKEQYLKDFVAVACARIGPNPYTWGGRFYPDCSALLMDSLLACGITCPRNTSEQMEELGEPFEFVPDFSDLKRGDLVFWKKHVAIMTDSRLCVHSTIAKPHRRVVEQPLEGVIHDQEEDGNGRPILVRRLPNYSF